MTEQAATREFEALTAEIGAALADVVVLMQQGKDCAEEVASTLAEMSQALESGAGAKDITEAIRALRIEVPAVTVENKINVQPTPVENHITVQPAPAATPVVQILERAAARDFEISGITYDNMSRITGARIRAVEKGKP